MIFFIVRSGMPMYRKLCYVQIFWAGTTFILQSRKTAQYVPSQKRRRKSCSVRWLNNLYKNSIALMRALVVLTNSPIWGPCFGTYFRMKMKQALKICEKCRRFNMFNEWVRVLLSSIYILRRETNEEIQQRNKSRRRQELGHEEFKNKRGITKSSRNGARG